MHTRTAGLLVVTDWQSSKQQRKSTCETSISYLRGINHLIKISYVVIWPNLEISVIKTNEQNFLYLDF